jgi:hypothetical protein
MCGLPDANWIKPDRKSNSFEKVVSIGSKWYP